MAGDEIVVRLSRVRNGWILVLERDGESDTLVCDDGGDTEQREAQAYARLLWMVLEIMGHCYNKYNPYNVAVRIEPGYSHPSYDAWVDDEYNLGWHVEERIYYAQQAANAAEGIEDVPY